MNAKLCFDFESSGFLKNEACSLKCMVQSGSCLLGILSKVRERCPAAQLSALIVKEELENLQQVWTIASRELEIHCKPRYLLDPKQLKRQPYNDINRQLSISLLANQGGLPVNNLFLTGRDQGVRGKLSSCAISRTWPENRMISLFSRINSVLSSAWLEYPCWLTNSRTRL